MKKIQGLFSLIIMMLVINPILADINSFMVITASNAANSNELLIYNDSGKLLQNLPTQGKGGVAPNIIGGGIAKMQDFITVINYGSQSVSLFKKQGDRFQLVKVIPSLSKPVSLAFGHNHLYILGETTIESHKMDGGMIADRPDGSSRLLVGDGSAAQVGVLKNQLIFSERSHTIGLVDLRDGIVTDSIQPVQLPPAPKNDTPVGLATKGDTAYVTIAHSDEVGLVKNGKLVKVLSSETQHAPCWLTLMGSWLFCSNTPSKSISRYNASANDLTLAKLIAVQTQGEPSDIDAEDQMLGALERGGSQTRLTLFQADNEGNFTFVNSFITAPTANGIAIIK